jgi:DNA-binding XRE family transcriptional regulator
MEDDWWLTAHLPTKDTDNDQAFDLMTPEELKQWRHNTGLTQRAAAEAIGVSRRNWQEMEAGEIPVKKTIELACVGYETRHNTQDKDK